MTGKRQHYVPQFLQRGFASHFDGDSAFTWVHRKNALPFSSNIKNVGVEGHFYSVNESSALDADPAITDFEGPLASLVGKLRLGYTPTLDDSPELAQLLAHLEIRTRHLRQSFLETGTALLDALLKCMSDEEIFGRFFLRSIQRDPSLMKDAMAKELAKHGISERLLPQIMDMAGPLIVQAMPGVVLQMSAFARQFRLSLSDGFDQAAKSGHVKALVRTLAPEQKVNHFQDLRFQVALCEETTLPLGDSAVLFHVEGERPFKPLFESKDKLVAAMLPIDTNHLLVGSYDHYHVDSARVRLEIARCSLEYFIASGNPPANNDLLPRIGESAQLLSQQQIEAMVDELINR